MTASIVGLRSPKDRLTFVIISLISLATWYVPVAGKAYAKTDDQQQSIVFEIKTPQNIQSLPVMTMADLQNAQEADIQKAKIDHKVALVRGYLESKGSPLAPYTEILLAQEDWKTIIAVSNAESNMGQHCYVNNCSGIFGQNGLRTYKSIPDWIVDMQQLIDQRYSSMSLKQMDGVYVQPYSYNWYLASTSVYNDLATIEQKFDPDDSTAQGVTLAMAKS